MVERRTNLNILADENMPFYDRVVTFEGPENLSVYSKVVSSVILNDINVACKLIKDQLALNGYNLHHANFYFKIDHRNELSLMFSSDIRASVIENYKDPPLQYSFLFKEDFA